MSGVLMAILSCSAAMGAVTLLALIVSPLLARRYARGALYALWLAVVLGFLLPVRPAFLHAPAVTVELPRAMSEPVRLSAPDRADEAQAGDPLAQAGGLAAMADKPYAPAGGLSAVGSEASADIAAGADGDSLPRRETAARESVASRMRAALNRVTPSGILLAVYLAGVAATLLAHLAAHMRFMRAVHRWQRPVVNGVTLEAYERACEAMSVKHAPALCRCAAVSSPMLVGLLRPRILLPKSAPGGHALVMVLRHELTHYRRHDLLLRALMLLATAMHWFNPAVYLCVRAAVYYGELSCDERAVRGTDRDQRAAYGNVILAALGKRADEQSLLTTGFGVDKGLLKRRLIAMMDMKKRRRGAFAAVLALTLVVALGGSFALTDGSAAADSGAGMSGVAVPEGAAYTARDVFASQTVAGEETGGATFTVHDVYFDGYLLLLNTTLSPNAEGEGVYCGEGYFDTMRFPDSGDREEVEAQGLIPVRAHFGVFARTADGAVLEANHSEGVASGRGREMTSSFVLAPDKPQDAMSASVSIGVVEDPKTWVSAGSQTLALTVPVTERAQTRVVPLTVRDEALAALHSVLIAETEKIANVYIYYTGDACPVGVPHVQTVELGSVYATTGYDGTLGMSYLHFAVRKDGPLETVSVIGDGSRTCDIDLNDGTVEVRGDGVDAGSDAIKWLTREMESDWQPADAQALARTDAYELLEELMMLCERYGDFQGWNADQYREAAQVLVRAGLISQQQVDSLFEGEQNAVRYQLLDLLPGYATNIEGRVAMTLWDDKRFWTKEQKLRYSQMQTDHGLLSIISTVYLPYDDADEAALARRAVEYIRQRCNIDLDAYETEYYSSYHTSGSGEKEPEWQIVFCLRDTREALATVNMDVSGEILTMFIENPVVDEERARKYEDEDGLRRNGLTLEEMADYAGAFRFPLQGLPGPEHVTQAEARRIAEQAVLQEGYAYDVDSTRINVYFDIAGLLEGVYPKWHINYCDTRNGGRTDASVEIDAQTGEVLDVRITDWSIPGLG